VLKKTFAIVLGLSLLSLGLLPVGAQTAQESLAASKTRSHVYKLGVGPKARVEVRLRDNTRIKGYIADADQNSFTVKDEKTGAMQTLSYGDVGEVKKPGGGLSTKSWIMIGAAVGGAAITWAIVKLAVCDGGAQTRFPC